MKILIVEDEPSLRELIQCSLEKERYVVETASDFNSALRKVEDYDYDCILLDIMLPDGSGLDLLERLKALHKRENVIIISAKDSLEDKVLGLELGADDYMIKPFDSKELVARVKAVLRRYQAVPAPAPVTAATAAQQQGDYVEYPDLIINLTNYSVIYQGMTIDMPPKELELLYFLASSPNQVFTREQLLDHIWGYEYIGDTRTVDVHIKRLREKIKDHPSWSISTVWGIGYKFEVKS